MPVTRDCAAVVDCRGIVGDPPAHATPLVSNLLATGAARGDPLRTGREVALDCRVVEARGRASDRIFAVGSAACASGCESAAGGCEFAARAGGCEITALPDIREVARLAARLAAAFAEGYDAQPLADRRPESA